MTYMSLFVKLISVLGDCKVLHATTAKLLYQDSYTNVML